MHFESADRSVVRSVRQRDLLNAWTRVYKRERALPLMHQFQPEHLQEEKPDLMYYDIRSENEAYRYLILHSGRNLEQAFGTPSGEGQFLDDVIGSKRMASIAPAFETSIDSRRPVYTASTVYDTGGVQVSYERLVLPFGANNRVQQLIVSLKMISIEGRFTTRDLMRSAARGPSYVLAAVIDREVDASRTALANDVVEI
jgi:hypothetical protein